MSSPELVRQTPSAALPFRKELFPPSNTLSSAPKQQEPPSPEMDAEGILRNTHTPLYRYQLTPFMQVYAHLQVAALRLNPDRMLIVPNRTHHAQIQHIRTWWTQDMRTAKFDLAQVCTFSVHVHDTSQFSSSAHCSREPLYSDVVLHSGQKMPHPQNTRSGRKPLCCLGVPGLRSFSAAALPAGEFLESQNRT